MSFFSKFSDFIASPVGNALTNRPEDVRRVKENFKTLGIYDEDAESGYITRGLDSAIKTFQRDNDLKVDGRINPRGETESRIFDVLENGLTKIGEAKPKPMPQAPSGRSGGIGFGTGLTDFIIERDEETPESGSIVTLRKGLKQKTPPVPKRRPVLATQQRKDVILKDKDANFKIVSNPDADGSKPLYAVGFFSEVNANEKTIEHEAKSVGIDPDMVKAIVHLETTQGYYDRIVEKFGVQNKTIRPMNVHAAYWKDLGFNRDDLKYPKKNIQAGVKLIKRIQDKMPNASAAKVATIYNSLGARKVSDYGARVEKLMKEKPWKK